MAMPTRAMTPGTRIAIAQVRWWTAQVLPEARPSLTSAVCALAAAPGTSRTLIPMGTVCSIARTTARNPGTPIRRTLTRMVWVMIAITAYGPTTRTSRMPMVMG